MPCTGPEVFLYNATRQLQLFFYNLARLLCPVKKLIQFWLNLDN